MSTNFNRAGVVFALLAGGLVACDAPDGPVETSVFEGQRNISPAPELVLKNRAKEAAAASKLPARRRAGALPGRDQEFGAPQFEAEFDDAESEARARDLLGRDGLDRDPCARCGDDVGCRLLCFSGEAEFSPEGDLVFECLECGRETGFLGRPELAVEFLDEGDVRLSWSALPGADRYELHGFRWMENGERSGASAHQSMVYPTRQTEVTVNLDRDYVYAFYVVAWSADRKTRSLPSEPVRIEPDP